MKNQEYQNLSTPEKINFVKGELDFINHRLISLMEEEEYNNSDQSEALVVLTSDNIQEAKKFLEGQKNQLENVLAKLEKGE